MELSEMLEKFVLEEHQTGALMRKFKLLSNKNGFIMIYIPKNAADDLHITANSDVYGFSVNDNTSILKIINKK